MLGRLIEKAVRFLAEYLRLRLVSTGKIGNGESEWERPDLGIRFICINFVRQKKFQTFLIIKCI